MAYGCAFDLLERGEGVAEVCPSARTFWIQGERFSIAPQRVDMAAHRGHHQCEFWTAHGEVRDQVPQGRAAQVHVFE